MSNVTHTIGIFIKHCPWTDHLRLAVALVLGFGSIYFFYHIANVLTARIPNPTRTGSLGLLLLLTLFLLLEDVIWNGVIVAATKKIKSDV